MKYAARVSIERLSMVRRLLAGLAPAIAGALAGCGPSSDPAPVSHPPGDFGLTSIRPDSTLEGTLTLRFGSTEVISGGFRAVWRPRRLFCG